MKYFVVEFLTRSGCHLCDEARPLVQDAVRSAGGVVEEVDIDTDPALVHRFGEEIPVTFVDGRQHDFWRVDERRLRAALAD